MMSQKKYFLPQLRYYPGGSAGVKLNSLLLTDSYMFLCTWHGICTIHQQRFDIHDQLPIGQNLPTDKEKKK